MRRPTFTIGSLLVLVVFLAVGLAALRSATEVWESGVFGLTLLVLLASILLAVQRSGPRRAYWLGFAVFGWTYLALVEVPSIAPRLPTTHALNYLDSLVPGRSDTISIGFRIKQGASGTTPTTSPWGETVFATSPTGPAILAQNIRLWNAATGRAMGTQGESTKNFIRIGHSLLALMLGFVGAFASRSIYVRERRGSGSTRLESPVDQETSTSSPTSSSDPAGSPVDVILIP